LPAKNDDAVILLHRVAFIAGKPRSYKRQVLDVYVKQPLA